ncbi:MAG: sigma-70 family RNA polymerase sigma factor [Actinobacteria bacterium]|nr:sigma-70 family RNA polymerase sigma factor [Actinomycetota bacterium]
MRRRPKETIANTQPNHRPTEFIVHKEDPAMTIAPASSYPAWEVERYIGEVMAEATRVLVRKHAAFDVDDILGEILAKLATRIADTMDRYPNPVVYAHAVCGNQAIDFVRAQNAQRGAGARNRRKVVSGDAQLEDSDSTVFDGLVAREELLEDRVLDRLETAYREAEIALGIPSDEWEALRLTDMLGYSDAQAAEILGIARETVNRRKNRARKRCQELLS